MRLPIVTREHAIHEDARAHNEALYTAFLSGERIAVPVTPESVHRVQLDESGNYRRFWLARGFRIRTKRNQEHTVLAVWLERLEAVLKASTAPVLTDEERRCATRMLRMNELIARDIFPGNKPISTDEVSR